MEASADKKEEGKGGRGWGKNEKMKERRNLIVSRDVHRLQNKGKHYADSLFPSYLLNSDQGFEMLGSNFSSKKVGYTHKENMQTSQKNLFKPDQ